jgi:S-adenosylmethionine:tRNA ribosyltransferase-isomerase
VKLSDFDYDLPPEFIAQQPADPRDSSRLMVLHRAEGRFEHRIFRDILDYLHPGDVLMMNTTRVIPARIPAVKATGGHAEILLLRQLTPTRWRTLVGGRRLGTGATLTLPGVAVTATVVVELEESEREIEFSQPLTGELLAKVGEMPLPPYIQDRVADPERYQTVYSQQEGSAAAPTAGLHFTPALLDAVQARGVEIAHCLLHIGLDTFLPVRVEDITQHHIHSERAILSAEAAARINAARQAGGRIVAVGTTTARTLETAAILSAGGEPAQAREMREREAEQAVVAFERDTDLYIYPGHRWRAVDALITNFHLPKSTLLMMISSFAGREFVLDAYEAAKREGYRFFSFGDAMLIL